MKLAYILNKHITIDKLTKDLQKIISKIPQEELSTTTLTISLQKIIDYTGDSPIPKITYEGDSLT